MLATLVMLLIFVGVGFAIARLAFLAKSRLGSAKLTLEQWERHNELRRAQRERYLESLPFVSVYHLVVIFVFASVLGLVLETLWWFVTEGFWQHRYGMIWGPLSPLYGFGAVLLTVSLWGLRKKPAWIIFLIAMFVGSLLEQLVGMVIENVFGAVSWTYESYPDAITKYVALRMSIIWGSLGIAWARAIMPEIVFLLGSPKEPGRTIVVVVLTAFLVADGAMTMAVSLRKTARDAGIPATNILDQFIDWHYDDEFIEDRFENLQYVSPVDGAGLDGAGQAGENNMDE